MTSEIVVLVILPLLSNPVIMSVVLPHKVAKYHLIKLLPSAWITLKSDPNPVINGFVIHVDFAILVK